MPSRRDQIKMDVDECANYIDDAKTLIIVSNGKNGFPHAMPMWFSRDDLGRFICTTFGKSQKVLNWKRDNRATLLIESGTEYSELQGVMIYATAEVIEKHDDVIDTLVQINSRGRNLSRDQRSKLRDSVASTAQKRVLLRFTPERYVTWDHKKLHGRY